MATDTWAEALRDPHVTIHWLIEVRGMGTVLRYADVDLDIEGKHWIGALNVRTNPGVYVDPYTSAPSSPNAIVTLRPVPREPGLAASPRPLDIEAIYRRSMLAMVAKLYRWAEGTPYSQAQLLLNAYVHEANIDEAGNFTLTLVDRILRYDRRFPRWTVNDQTWPNAYEDDKGSGYPLLYGTFTRVPSPVIDVSDGTYDYILAAEGEIATISQAFYDDAALTTETLQTATDAKGHTVSRVRVTKDDDGAVADKQVTLSGTGYKDSADGRYSGTASALLTHPADQLWHMAETFAEVLPEEIDVASFKALRSELAGWTASPQVLADESGSFFEIREELGILMRSAIYPERGVLTAKHLNFKRAPALHIAEGENMVEMGSIGWGDKSNLINQLLIKYAWGYKPKTTRMTWLKSIDIDENDEPAFEKNRQILRGMSTASLARRRLVEARSVQSVATAQRIADKLVELHEKPRKEVKCRVNRDGHDLEIYDVVQLTYRNAPTDDGTGWARKRFIVSGITYGLDEDNLQLLEC